MKLIDKDALVAEIKDMKGCKKSDWHFDEFDEGYKSALEDIFSFLDTLEVIDPYEQLIQYSSIEDGIKAHAEEYSFNIESELFQQLTPEQQKLWRKEIEQAVISGGYNGLDLARDTRYKENLEVKEVDLEEEDVFIEKACKWLKFNYTEYLNDTRIGIDIDEMVKDFKMDMKGE